MVQAASAVSYPSAWKELQLRAAFPLRVDYDRVRRVSRTSLVR